MYHDVSAHKRSCELEVCNKPVHNNCGLVFPTTITDHPAALKENVSDVEDCIWRVVIQEWPSPQKGGLVTIHQEG
jgi:hypothetical protein